MREIKFRAWHKEDKEMAEVSSLEKHWIACGAWGDQREKWEVMQYTGLRDKNGKEIYEGDVVEFEILRDGVVYSKTVEQVNFSLGQFNIYGDPLKDFHNIEIVGNIYENQDLIQPHSEGK